MKILISVDLPEVVVVPLGYVGMAGSVLAAEGDRALDQLLPRRLGIGGVLAEVLVHGLANDGRQRALLPARKPLQPRRLLVG